MTRSQRLLAVTGVVLLVAVVLASAFPAEDPKSAFGVAFDEIVVESQLTVRGKGSGLRQSRTKKLEVSTAESITSAPLKRSKRQRNNPYHRFSSSSASSGQASAQDFTVNGPFGPWGASASQAGSQGFSAGPGGLTGSAAHSGSQQYRFPGFTADVAFSGGFSYGPNGASNTGGSSLTITRPDGSRRVYTG